MPEYPYSPLKDYGRLLSWSVGTLFCHEDVLFKYLWLAREFSFKLPIRWAFGAIQSPLAGGRVPPLNLDQMDAIGTLSEHIKEGIACRLTLSNPHIVEKDIVVDTKTQGLLKFLNESLPDNGARNGVILSSDILAEHVKNCYPNLQVILSTIRTAYDVGYGRKKDTFSWYSSLLENPLYDVVVVNNSKLYEEGFMEALPFKEKVELIACTDCVQNCQMARNHYEGLHEYIKRLAKGLDTTEANNLIESVAEKCVAFRESHKARHSSYSEGEIRRLAQMGYTQFKIAGRANSRERLSRDIWCYLFRHDVARFMETILLEP